MNMADAPGDTVAKRTRGLDRAFEILEFLRVRRQPAPQRDRRGHRRAAFVRL